jgi:hypothetical protein
MEVGVYTAQDEKLGAAFIKGARASGWKVKIRSANDFGMGDTEQFDLAFLCSMRTRNADLILSSYRRRRPKVPVVVIDYGFLKRACQEQFGGGGDYWQLSLDGLNAVPEFTCPPDRFDALGLELHEKGGDPEGPVVVCGQHAGDPSHGRMTEEQLVKWADEQIAYWSDLHQVAFRPHPFSPAILPTKACEVLAPEHYTTEEVIAQASMIVCQNSNIGHEALLAGVPVHATRGDAPYQELTPGLATLEARRAYFNRLAYAQWTLAEVEAGTWHRFYAERLSKSAARQVALA